MSKDLKLSLDRIKIKNDHDPWPKGAGEIYFSYSLDGGEDDYSDRTGTHSIHGGQSRTLDYNWKFNDVEQALSINIAVMEEDSGKDDHLPKDLVEYFSADENFGIGQHEWNTTDYTLYYTIFEV